MYRDTSAGELLDRLESGQPSLLAPVSVYSLSVTRVDHLPSPLIEPLSPKDLHVQQQTPTFGEFLDAYHARLRPAFHLRRLDGRSPERGLQRQLLREIRETDPFAAFVPEEYGGRGGHVSEGLAVLGASSYESLPLGLTLGINWALFLQPLAKYGREEMKAPVLRRFLRDKQLGGLMLTEPTHGTDALGMQTSFVEADDHYRIRGVKHWAGLTGCADYWLLAAREQGEKGLLRDIDLFLCDVSVPGQEIEVEEIFENLGLYMIPYGRNRIDVEVPKAQRLEPATTGISMLLDLLHRSRMQFPGIGVGFVRRLLDEALAHCKRRFVGGTSLFTYDQVQERLSRLQAAFTTCSAMCAFSSDTAGTENDLSHRSFEANAIKTVATDLMHEASQSLLQLVGAKGYVLDHIAGRSVVDSRPFQIFEGSNDVLYQQVADAILKRMRRAKETNLLRFLSSEPLTRRAAEHVRTHLQFDVDSSLPQRKLVELGRALGRILSLQFVLELGDRGFRADLVEGASAMLRRDVTQFLSGYRRAHDTAVVESYEEGSSWLDFVEQPLPA